MQKQNFRKKQRICIRRNKISINEIFVIHAEAFSLRRIFVFMLLRNYVCHSRENNVFSITIYASSFDSRTHVNFTRLRRNFIFLRRVLRTHLPFKHIERLFKRVHRRFARFAKTPLAALTILDVTNLPYTSFSIAWLREKGHGIFMNT